MENIPNRKKETRYKIGIAQIRIKCIWTMKFIYYLFVINVHKGKQILRNFSLLFKLFYNTVPVLFAHIWDVFFSVNFFIHNEPNTKLIFQIATNYKMQHKQLICTKECQSIGWSKTRNLVVLNIKLFCNIFG